MRWWKSIKLAEFRETIKLQDITPSAVLQFDLL